MTDAQRGAWLVGGLGILLVVGAISWIGRGPDPDPAAAARLEAGLPDQRIKVQVLNAGGVNGLAREVTGHLRAAGFDVVEYGNAASWDRDTTLVVDRVGRSDVAQAVADALGIGNVRSDPDPDLFVDVTVLLGREWRPDWPARGVGTAELPWWNLRRWLDP